MKSYFTLLVVSLIVFPVFAQEVLNANNDSSIVIENDTTVQNPNSGIPGQFNNLVGGLHDTSNSVRNGINGDSALLLISGGLFILLFVVPLAMINSMFWKRRGNVVTDTRNIGSGINYGTRFDIGYNTGNSLKAQHVDDILDAFRYLEDADVKIMNSTTTYKKIRVKGCRACEGKSSKKPICEFERGFFEGAFSNLHKSVEVRETECRAQGAHYCEFDVKIKR